MQSTGKVGTPTLSCFRSGTLAADCPTVCETSAELTIMDQVEALFPIPLLRSPGLLSPALNEAAVAAIRNARIEKNLRSDQLFHTEIANPLDNKLFQQMAELAVPKLVDFGLLMFGERLRWTVKEMWTNMLETGGGQTLPAHAHTLPPGGFHPQPAH